MSTAQTQPEGRNHARIPDFLASVGKLNATAASTISLLLGTIIFLGDWYWSPKVHFGPYYLLPIALAAWRSSTGFTGFLVLAASLARTVVLGRLLPAHSATYLAIDIATFICVYASAAYLLSNLRRAYSKLADEANALTSRVTQVERHAWLDASIRRAVIADVERIVELTVLGAEDGDLSEAVTSTARQASLRAAFENSIRQGLGPRRTWAGDEVIVPIEFWVSQINGQIAGYFMVIGLNGQQGSERELHAIVTAKDYRGVGVGSAMVDFYCSHYYGRKLYASVMPGAKMHQMLKRRGFFHYGDSDEGYVVLERVEWPREKGLLSDSAEHSGTP